jgi:(2S)-methylsuccinyl-CoA dehydrogenase
VTLDDSAGQAQFAVERLLERAVTAVRERVSAHGKLDAARIETEQHAAHGLAWLATYVEAIKEMAAYARRMREEGRFGETETLLTRIGLGEYLAQIFGGIAMNQGEIIRLWKNPTSNLSATSQSSKRSPGPATRPRIARRSRP